MQTVISDEHGNIFEEDDAEWYIGDVIRDNFGTNESAVQTQTESAITEKPER